MDDYRSQTEESATPEGHGGCCCKAKASNAPAAGTSETDPVCGMSVDPATAKHAFDHAGTNFHFCSAGCLAKFSADPEKYLATKPVEAPPAIPVGIYTCPMHPQIRQQGPGNCPI